MAREYFAEVNDAARARLPTLLAEWFPGARVVGRELQAGDINGGPGKSFNVNLDSCLWKDFASGEKGGNDPISLYAAIHGIKQGEAATRLGRALGIAPPPLRNVKDPWRPILPIPSDAPDPAKGEGFPRWRPDGKLTAAWLYCDAEGRPLLYRVRFDSDKGKDIVPLTWCRHAETGECAWRWKDAPAPRSLYNLEALAARPDAPVLVVEGEQTADAAARLLPEYVVLTWPGGAARAGSTHTDWKPLLARTSPVRLWPDNDDEGKRAVLAIASLFPADADLKIVIPGADWPAKHDLADLETEGWTPERVRAWIADHAVARDTDAARPQRPTVCLIGDDHGELQAATWTGVAEINKHRPHYFRTFASRELMVIERTPFGETMVVLNTARARALLTRDIYFTQPASNKGAARKGDEVATTPSTDLITSLTNAPDASLPVHRRFVTIPVFTASRRLITRPGYDAESNIYYAPSTWIGAAPIEIPEHPTFEDFSDSTMAIDEILGDFPFATLSDRAHAWALMILPLVRELIDGPTPLHRIEAPDVGTGKTLLADVLLKPTIRQVEVISETEDDEEWRKVLMASLRQSAEAIKIDNCRNLHSGVLAGVLTAHPTWGGRVLGSMEIAQYPITNVFVCTANNPVWSLEMLRRSIRIRLDAGVERPFERANFRHPELMQHVEQQRLPLLRALLTLVRWSFDRNVPAGPSKGSYEAWARVMGSILNGLGIEGFLAKESDQSVRRDGLLDLAEKWWEAFHSAEMRSSDLMGLVEEIDTLEISGRDEKARIVSLGKLLGAARDRIFGGFKLKSRVVRGRVLYWLEEMEAK